jgi:hypothetical protein
MYKNVRNEQCKPIKYLSDVFMERKHSLSKHTANTFALCLATDVFILRSARL